MSKFNHQDAIKGAFYPLQELVHFAPNATPSGNNTEDFSMKTIKINFLSSGGGGGGGGGGVFLFSGKAQSILSSVDSHNNIMRFDVNNRPILN